MPGIKSEEWLAGLLEGEGWFGTNVYHGRHGRYHNALIKLTMTDEDIVRCAHELVGCGAVRSYTPKNPEHKRKWDWTLSGPQAVLWMEKLLPYMGQRRSQRICEVLESIRESRLTGKETLSRLSTQRLKAVPLKRDCIHGHEFTPENTYMRGDSRVCRACMVRRKREWRHRKKLLP